MSCKVPSCVSTFDHWWISPLEGDVATWEDQVGSADFTSDTVGFATAEPGQLNGLSVVSFVGTGAELFEASSDFFSARKRFMISMVIERPVVASNWILTYGTFNADWSMYITADTNNLNLVMPTSLPEPLGNFANDADYFTGTTWTRLFIVFDGKYGTNAGRVKFYKDGTEETASYVFTFPDVSTTVTDQTIRIGQLAGSGFGTLIETRIAEIILTSKASYSLMEEIDNYFTTKYNL